MTRVLVTGATGKIGSRFVPRLLKRGHQVRVLARGETAEVKHLVSLGAELTMGDLLESSPFEKALDGIDAIVHLAALFRGATPEQCRAVNETATLRLASEALERGVHRFVFASTSLVYGPGAEHSVRENEDVNCQIPYPLSKSAAERALLDLHGKRGFDLRILRFAFVYGEGDPHLTDAFPLIKDWPSSKRFQLLHHADVAQALLLALQNDGIGGEIFNVADDAPLTLGELRALHNIKENRSANERLAGASPWDIITDTMKIRSVLGYRPYYPTFLSAWAAGSL